MKSKGIMPSKCYTTTGGLVFFATALSLLLQTNVSSAWSAPRNFARTTLAARQPSAACQPAAAVSIGNIKRATSALFSTPPPLASEGDWAAYSDEQYGRVYYFNHVTGESVWSKPTPTFPDVEGIGGFGQGNQNFGPDGPGFNQPPPSNQGPVGKPTLYQILNIPPTATREQVKQSYLDLAKRFHPDAVAKRGGDPAEGQRVFNDISRAWMVLSDDGLRRGYDESLGGWNNDDMFDARNQMDEANRVGPDGIRDATILRENKFEKNPVYKKKIEMNSSDGRGNKFARGPPGQQPGMRPNFMTSAPPLEIDYEAEAAARDMYQRGPMTASQATMLAQNAWREAISAEKRSLQRDAQSQMDELRAAQMQAQQWNNKLENERKEQNMEQSRRREERRRNAERGVVDTVGTGGASMEERLRMRKAKRAGEEAERVGRELTKLGGLGAGLGSPGGGSSGIVGGPSERPDAFFGGQTQRSTAKSSSNIREEQRLNSLLKKGAGGGGVQGQPQRNGPMVADRPNTAATTDKAQVRNPNKEMLDLKNKYEAEIDRLKTEMMQIAENSQSNQLKELVSNHKMELERVKQQMEAASNERLENELRALEEKHANEMKSMERQMQKGGGAASQDDQRVQEMESVISSLKEEHASEIAKMKEEFAKNAGNDQSNRLQQMEASYKQDMEQMKIDLESAAAKELQIKLQELEAAHKWQLQSLQAGHQAEMSKSQKDSAEKLRWEVERSISALKRDHEREIEKLRSEAIMNVSESDAIETMKLNHEAEMELLRAELFGEAASDLEEAIASLTGEHQAEIARMKANMEKQAEEQIQQMKRQLEANMTADLETKTADVEKQQQIDMEQVKQDILATANLTEAEQIKKLEEKHRQEIEDLKKAADARLEEEILKVSGSFSMLCICSQQQLGLT